MFDFDNCGNGWLFLDIAYSLMLIYRNEPNKTLFKDKMILYSVMFLVIFVFYFQLKTNIRVANFYLNSTVGSILLTIYSALFILGVFTSLDLNKVEY